MRPPYQPNAALTAAARNFTAGRSLIAASPTTAAAAPRLTSSSFATSDFIPHRTLFPTTIARFASSSSSSASSSSTSSSPAGAPTSKGPIRDESIIPLSPLVRLVDPKTGSLAGPFPTRQILSKLDRTKFFLQQVAPAQPSRSTTPYDPTSPPPNPVDPSLLVQYAICKLIDKKEEFDRLRALKRKSQETSSTASAASSGGSSSKEVQLTWSVSPNDLSHKLGKAKKELLKGARINVVISTKPGGRKYIKGLNPEVDEKRQRLLDDVEVFLCTERGEKRQEADGEAEAETGAELRIARRLGDVDWQRGGSAAVMSFECFRK